jgi:hypothetical protein
MNPSNQAAKKEGSYFYGEGLLFNRNGEIKLPNVFIEPHGSYK